MISTNCVSLLYPSLRLVVQNSVITVNLTVNSVVTAVGTNQNEGITSDFKVDIIDNGY